MQCEMELSQEVNPNLFNYYTYWEQQEPAENPHRQRAIELFGVKVDGVPVSHALPKLNDCLKRIRETYNITELEEEGINVEELLAQYTEIQVMEYLEENGFEKSITFGEIEGLMFSNEWQNIIQLPKIESGFFLLRQYEEMPNGKFIDVSPYNTQDFIRGLGEDWEFDNYKYFTDKVAERVEDLAIMHSCISDEERRNNVKQKYIALVNNKFRNYALKLCVMIKTTKDEEKKVELMEKFQKQNKQIRRLRVIWNKYAYNW